MEERTELMQSWLERIDGRRARVVLADGDDERVQVAAARLAKLGIEPVLISDLATPTKHDGVEVMSTQDLATGSAGKEVYDLLRERGKPEEFARTCSRDAIYLGACLARRGDVHAAVAGSNRPTSDVLRAGLHVMGLAEDTKSLSSSFLLRMPDGRVFCFADCSVIPEPTIEQLADIAISSARTFTYLSGERPMVALLSFSTKGSAAHPSLDRLRKAREIVSARAPELVIDDELQFDAALVESVARRKAPDSLVAGHANVFVFPDLASGNIGYKIAERWGGAQSFGPLLQGLSGVINDLSRGCSVEDIVNVSLISSLQALQS